MYLFILLKLGHIFPDIFDPGVSGTIGRILYRALSFLNRLHQISTTVECQFSNSALYFAIVWMRGGQTLALMHAGVMLFVWFRRRDATRFFALACLAFSREIGIPFLRCIFQIIGLFYNILWFGLNHSCVFYFGSFSALGLIPSSDWSMLFGSRSWPLAER
jgi:hypothetical protein